MFFIKYADIFLDQAMMLVDNPDIRKDLTYYELADRNIGPHRMASQVHKLKGEYNKAIELLEKLKGKVSQTLASVRGSQYKREEQMLMQNLIDVEGNILLLKLEKAYDEGGMEGAQAEATRMLAELNQSNEPQSRMLAGYVSQFMRKLEFENSPADTISELSTENQSQ